MRHPIEVLSFTRPSVGHILCQSTGCVQQILFVLVSPKNGFVYQSNCVKKRQQRVVFLSCRVSKIDRLQAEFISLNPTLKTDVRGMLVRLGP